MKKVLYDFMLLVLLLLLVSGCATLADASSARGQGKSRVYDTSFDTVWNTVPEAVNELGLRVASKNRQEGCILATKGMTAFSYGENVAVFVEKVDDERTKVEVVSKKTMGTNIFAWNWEKPILDKLSEMLNSK